MGPGAVVVVLAVVVDEGELFDDDEQAACCCFEGTTVGPERWVVDIGCCDDLIRLADMTSGLAGRRDV